MRVRALSRHDYPRSGLLCTLVNKGRLSGYAAGRNTTYKYNKRTGSESLSVYQHHSHTEIAFLATLDHLLLYALHYGNSVCHRPAIQPFIGPTIPKSWSVLGPFSVVQLLAISIRLTSGKWQRGQCRRRYQTDIL